MALLFSALTIIAMACYSAMIVALVIAVLIDDEDDDDSL
jgi:hypothetical protein